MRRFFSFFMLIIFIFTLNINIIYALDINNTNSLQNVWVNSNLEAQFLNDLWNKTYKINFQDVTASNAWKVIKTWKWKTNIPTKFVLEGGFSLDLDQTNLDSYMTQTQKFKDDVIKLNKTTWFKSITQEDIELSILPDRLQIKQKTTVKFTWKKFVEPSLVWDVLPKKSNWPTEEELKNDKKVKALKLWKDVNIPDNSDELLINEIVKDCKANSSELPSQLKWNCTYDSIKTRFENIEKTLVTEEKVEISIIPPSFNDVTKKTALTRNPIDARITKNEIKTRFETYKKIQKTKNTYTLKYKWKYFTLDQSKFDTFQKSYNQKYQLQNSNTGAVIGWWVSYDENSTAIGWWISYSEEIPYIYEDISTCDRYTNIQDKNDCKDLFTAKENATVVKYNQMLLNGFTLWQADSKYWSKSLYAFDYKVFKARVEIWYTYWFWIRIPMSTEINLQKNILDDYAEWDKIYNNYNFDVKVNTENFDVDDYLWVWINQNQTFKWNEFVLELDAYLHSGIYLRWIINEEFNISLVDTVIRALLTYMWVDQEVIDMVVTPDKWFNESSTFTPPFAWDNEIKLFEPIDWAYPFIEESYLVLKWWVLIQALLDWSIEADCENINSNWWCPSNIRFDTKDKKSYTWTAVFNENSYTMDKLGAYSNFGPKLDNFQYISKITVEMLAYGVVSAKVPIIDEWYSYTTPKWELYKFSMDAWSLGTHAWTDGVVDATLNNKVYSAYKNPVPLDNDYSNKVLWIETVYVDENEVDTIIDDSYIDVSKFKNMQWLNRVVYSTDWSDPECTSTNILTYHQNKIWPNSKEVLENTKNITLKTRSCDVFWNKTSIKTSTYQVRNTYFEPKYILDNWTMDKAYWLKLPWTMWNNVESYIYYNYTYNSDFNWLEINADTFWTNSSFIAYTLDWTAPTCLIWWTSFRYTWKIPKTTLEKYKKESKNAWSAWEITVKSVQCINLSWKQTFKSNISTLTLNILPSNIDKWINSIEWTNSDLLWQWIWNLLNWNWINWGLIDWLGNNIWWNAWGPQIWTMNVDYNVDWIQRKYANTRMTGCDENDIILWAKVWASCNSNYELPNTRYYSATNSSSKDINWWNYWKLYHSESVLCPSWYNVPTETDFKNLLLNKNNISILKLPASWAYAYNKYQNKDLKWYYWITWNDSKFAWFKIEPYETNIGAFWNDLAFLPIRCIRSTPATFEEKNGDLEVVDNGLTMTGWLYQTSHGSGFNNSYWFLKQTEELTSKDEYVNEKLSEINNCFVDNYNYHLANLNSTIEKLKLEKDKQTSVNDIRKYQLAIEKLEEIKKLFIIRYGSIINLSND